MSEERRVASLDVAKGVAILFVIAIHAELSSPSLVYDHAINRAVPMFLVLFGATSMLWYNKQDSVKTLPAWYRSRLGRLLPSYWLAVAVWWIGQRILSTRPLGIDALAWSLAGYAPWIQTSWFVTTILQIVVIFPALRLAFLWLGSLTSLLVGLTILAAVQFYALPLNDWLRGVLPRYDATLGFYALWLFVPAYLWLIFSGMCLGRRSIRVTPAQALLALLLAFGSGVFASSAAEPSAVSRIAMAAADPARTLLLIAGSAATARVALASAPFSWCGRNSWEIYLGQMMIHSLAYPAWCRLGGPSAHRVEYAAVLLIGGVGFALVYSELRRRLSARAARA